MNKPLKIRLHVLSPIHIGCDDVYEPTSFVIDEERNKLIEFDPVVYIKNLTPQEFEEFKKVSSSDNLLAIFKTIKRFYKPQIKGKEIEVSNFLVNHYKKILNMGTFDRKAVINQFTIEKTAYLINDKTPYIPGSSLKGSLRTAYLSALAEQKGITKWKGTADELETKLLNLREGREKMSSDPFRMVKVSDLLPVENVSTKVVYAINRKKTKTDKELLSERSGLYQILETIKPEAVFEGMLNIDLPQASSGIQNPVTIENLLKYTHSFYAGNLKEEIDCLHKALGIKHQAGILGNAKFKEQFKQTAFLIRLGRHSGAEAVTIEGNRYIKINQGHGRQPKYLDSATTFWLASDEPRPANNSKLIPFGWAVLEVVE